MPNINGGGEVDLASMNTTIFAMASQNKLSEAEEMSDAKHCAASDSKTNFLSTGSTTEILAGLANNSTSFDGGTPSLKNQTSTNISVKTSDCPCLIPAENEDCSSKTGLCTHSPTHANVRPVTSNEVNVVTLLSGPSNRDNSQHYLENDANLM